MTTATDVVRAWQCCYTSCSQVGIRQRCQRKRRPIVYAQWSRSEPAPVSDAAAKADKNTAQARATVAHKLARTLQGDLDNIVAKALKKQATERYPTVAALAEDLRRYLDHEPVSARADSLAYRASKFVRRYRLAVGAASVTLLALLGRCSRDNAGRRGKHSVSGPKHSYNATGRCGSWGALTRWASS